MLKVLAENYNLDEYGRATACATFLMATMAPAMEVVFEKFTLTLDWAQKRVELNIADDKGEKCLIMYLVYHPDGIVESRWFPVWPLHEGELDRIWGEFMKLVAIATYSSQQAPTTNVF